MDSNKPLGLGLIGCGAFGRFCIEAFNELDGIQAVAVADVRRDSAEQLGADMSVPAFGDPAELFARDDVDIVHIATPPSTHYELVMGAIRAGKHVLCEKPLATKLDHADEMLAAAADGGLIAPVNFVLRYNRITECVKAVIESGVLGKVLSARLTNCAGDSPLPAEHWFWNKSVSGGIFVEHGVHFFDLYSHWLGAGRVISAHSEIREGTTQEDRVMCTIRHDSGVVASHYHGFDQMSLMDRTDHRLVCEHGDIRVEGWIPLRMSIDAALSDESVEKLTDICGGCVLEVTDVYNDQQQSTISRSVQRKVSKRIRLEYCPLADKQAVYAGSVVGLMADQVAYLRQGDHSRRITEQNGRDALALAQGAAEMAQANLGCDTL